MKILAISQAYWPDTASISQHLTDLSIELSAKGHDISIITSRNDYENSSIKYKKNEIYLNINISRLSNTSLGKGNKLTRLVDFATFNFLVFLKLLRAKKTDYHLIIGLTQPPLLGFIGIIIAKLKKIKFLYWAMDLQPELSIIAGYMKRNSISARILQNIGDYIFKHSNTIIALDKYMQQHILQRVKTRADIHIIPVWPVMEEIYLGARLQNPFRIQNNFGDKIIIMYSGNHSVMHSLDTLLAAERILHKDSRFLFVHIGGGIRLKDVRKVKQQYKLENIRLLPYQPRDLIHLSLGAADLHVVILGENCVGYTHPNKIYGAMYIGKPILAIGPKKSHISDVLDDCPGNISISHGEIKKLVDLLLEFGLKDEDEINKIGQSNHTYAQTHFSKEYLLAKMIDAVEACGTKKSEA